MSSPSAYDLTRQARWETEGFRRAALSYREAAAAQDFTSLPPGKAMLRLVVPPLVRAIEAAKEPSPDRQPKPFTTPLFLLPAEQLAVVVVSCACRAAVENAPASQGPHRMGRVGAVAKTISASVRMQVEFNHWAGEHQDLLETLRRRYPQLNRSFWKRRRDHLKALREADWEERLEVGFGALMVKLLVDAAPAWFALDTMKLPRGKTERYLRATEKTLDLVADLTARAEVCRPMLLPMLIPPNPWRYEA